MEKENIKYVRIDASWYNELIRAKARYDFLVDSLISSNLKDYDTWVLNDYIIDYYCQMGNPEFI